jgi:hypothetical protein
LKYRLFLHCNNSAGTPRGKFTILFTTQHFPRPVSCQLSAISHELKHTNDKLNSSHYPFRLNNSVGQAFTIHHSPLLPGCQLSAISQRTLIHYSLLTFHLSLFTSHLSPHTSHFSPLSHYSLFTIYLQNANRYRNF